MFTIFHIDVLCSDAVCFAKESFSVCWHEKAQISCFRIVLLQTNTCLEKTAEWNPLICLFRLNQIAPLFAPRVSWLLFTHVCWVTRRKYPGILLGIKKGKLADHQYIFWAQLTHDTQPRHNSRCWWLNGYSMSRLM